MTHARTDPDVEEQQVREHLEDVEDGCGCAEIWEHLSEQRDGDN